MFVEFREAMKKKIIAALLGASLLAGGGAYAAQQAQTNPAPRGPMMKADANNDGIVTREETLAGADARFAKTDANKDGQISAEERRAARPEHRGGKRHGFGGPGRGERRAQMLERFDADKDGKLSDAERQAARAAFSERRGERGAMRAKLLERFDTDKDGKLSDAERSAAREARRAARPEGDRGFGRGGAGRARIDTNGDKLISLAESRAAALAIFDRVDANSDGRIDAAERQAAHAKMKSMRGHRGHGGPRGDVPPTAGAQAPDAN